MPHGDGPSSGLAVSQRVCTAVQGHRGQLVQARFPEERAFPALPSYSLPQGAHEALDKDVKGPTGAESLAGDQPGSLQVCHLKDKFSDLFSSHPHEKGMERAGREAVCSATNRLLPASLASRLWSQAPLVGRGHSQQGHQPFRSHRAAASGRDISWGRGAGQAGSYRQETRDWGRGSMLSGICGGSPGKELQPTPMDSAGKMPKDPAPTSNGSLPGGSWEGLLGKCFQGDSPEFP